MVKPGIESPLKEGIQRDTQRVNTMFSTCQYVVEQKLSRSNVIDLTAASQAKVPRFDRHEITDGRVVGRGGFAVIREITSIDLDVFGDKGRRPSGSSRATASTEKSSSCQIGERVVMAKSVKGQKKERKYVLKELLKDEKASNNNQNAYMNGLVDMAMEAQYLTHLSHPNILTLKGISTSNQYGGDDGMFLVLEYLPETLSKRLSYWAQRDRATKGITGFVTRSRSKAVKLLATRLSFARDIANAMRYLHSKQIIFRDLKPDNLGFTVDDEIKLFDFGLAKELQDRDRDANGLYRQMTGFTGAVRYMAPEVGLSKRYNLSADVYSFSMVLWHIMALEPPLCLYTPKMMLDRVFQKGYRPVTSEKWPIQIRALLTHGWHNDTSRRPTMDQVCEILEQVITDLASGKSD